MRRLDVVAYLPDGFFLHDPVYQPYSLCPVLAEELLQPHGVVFILEIYEYLSH